MNTIYRLLNELKILGDYFLSKGIEDIYTNSKIYEVLMAHSFNHTIINGHAYTPDARDYLGNLYEYKHFKLLSSNHSWTFNDFSDETIEHLNEIAYVYFSIIDDTKIVPVICKTYKVAGRDVSRYLKSATLDKKNKRKMINISELQITNIKDDKLLPSYKLLSSYNHKPWKELNDVFYIANELEEVMNIRGILTSNKLWELLVGLELNHHVNSDQKKHDAIDESGNTYEYKVSSKASWAFQDISDNVLDSYLSDKFIILAVVNKKEFLVDKIYACSSYEIVSILKYKLTEKSKNNKEIKRLSASIGITDVHNMIKNGYAKCVYSRNNLPD